ncbi:MAG: alpha/beta hydrolase [Firmicutes bacterium]|nr:alpha/beta hydrolase [Bacillota bacterium]
MFGNAENLTFSFEGKTVDYVAFGSGSRPIVLIPGLSDGLRTVKGMAGSFGFSYRALAEDARVYCFSRVNELCEGYTIMDMADDLAAAIEGLGIAPAGIIGVSQGGMIAQELALRRPDLISRMVLMVTAPCAGAPADGVIAHWLELAEEGDVRSIMIDTAERSYSEKYLLKTRPMYPFIGGLLRRKDLGRFIIQAKSCLSHDALDRLGNISCPVLVIGGSEDRIVGAEASYLLAERIPGAKLHMYEGLGHGLYDETRAWQKECADFLEGGGKYYPNET